MIKQHLKLTKDLLITLFALSIALCSNVIIAAGLATVIVKQTSSDELYIAEGVVEAIKSSSVAPQVTGSVISLIVKAGDEVKAGQVLARIDTRLANQQAMANQAQVAAAKAQLSAAKKEYERKARLYAKQYISQAAMERAESDFKTAEAQANAQLAQSGMSSVETGLHIIRAPFAGVVAEVLTEVGDMAMPGKPLVSIYDPNELRVTVNVPQSKLAELRSHEAVHLVVISASEKERNVVSTKLTVLPVTDAVSNMTKVRLTLPKNLLSIRPGMFARAMLPISNIQPIRQIYVPLSSVIRRSELVAVYVVDKQGKPQLRQVRLGRKQGLLVEVFAGLEVGEAVALDPIAAANVK